MSEKEYSVEVEYRGRYQTNVYASSKQEAEEKAIDEADDNMLYSVDVYAVDVEELGQ